MGQLLFVCGYSFFRSPVDALKARLYSPCISGNIPCSRLTVVFALDSYKLYQNGIRHKAGTAWAQTVQIENGKTVQNDLLFTRWDGTPLDLNRVTTWFPKFMQEHDLPAVTVHSLRHTYASLLIAAHVPIVTVAGRLGHAQTSTTTDIYAGFIKSADAAASDTMDAVFDHIKQLKPDDAKQA